MRCDPALQGAITALAGGDLRVWSFVVTILGDRARAPGQELSGAELSALTEAAGIKPQALRTALHRLRKDGWIDSRRAGRGAFHFLTEDGRAQAEAAAARIYAFDPMPDTGWHLVVTRDRIGALPDHVAVAPGCFLGTGAAPDLTDALTLSGPDLHLPGWLSDQVLPSDLAEDYARFEQVLRLADAALETRPPDALEAAVLRALLVHGWRRLVLRHPALPDRLYPADWAGPACRTLVRSLLNRLP